MDTEDLAKKLGPENPQLPNPSNVIQGMEETPVKPPVKRQRRKTS